MLHITNLVTLIVYVVEFISSKETQLLQEIEKLLCDMKLRNRKGYECSLDTLSIIKIEEE